jgi:DNA repair exonuclease SbcCD ATPase subunit
MTMAVALTNTDLDRVFDEIEDAQADVEVKRRAMQAAEKDAEEAKGLPGAAQRNLQNAEARLRVLKLAQAEAEKDPQYAELVQQLNDAKDKYAKAQSQAAAVKDATKALDEFKTELRQWVAGARQITGTLGSHADTVAALSVLQDAETRKINVADAVRNQGTDLDSRMDQLGGPLTQQLSGAMQQIRRLAPSYQQLGALQRKMSLLEGQLQAARSAQENAPQPGEVDKAKAGYAAAKTAAVEAPEVERDSQVKLTLARQELAAAEDRRTAALVAKDAAERSWIEGIDIVGPGADGAVIAKAKLVSATLPEGYSLEWTFDGVPVQSEPAGAREGYIRFNTKGMASGSYAIAVHLHRDQATE